MKKFVNGNVAFPVLESPTDAQVRKIKKAQKLFSPDEFEFVSYWDGKAVFMIRTSDGELTLI